MPSLRLWLLLSPPIVAGLFGVLVLQCHGTTAPRLALMLGAIVAGMLVATTLAARGRVILERFAPVLAAGALALLAATLFGEGLLGVRRWVTFGPVRLHASSIACPVLLAAAAALLSRARRFSAAVAIATAQVIHALQPDAGQSTALAAGVLTGLALWPAPLRLRAAGMGAVAVSIVPAWMRPDPLPPVPEVEGIVRLAWDLGRPAQVLSVVLVALLPASLAVAARGVKTTPSSTLERRRRLDGAVARATCATLASYIAGTVLVPMLGNFPVPVLGFGVSSVLGVGICVGFSAALGDLA
jgi:cell division protein FtsW (lipid II flippase)